MEHEELLKDCPFCGDKAVIGEGADHAYVTCRNCACATPVCSTVEQAMDICNTRASKDGNRRRTRTMQTYEKFIVLYNKLGNPPNAIPWTGLEPTLEFIKEKLEDGYTIQVKPFTREEWKER